jgi:hypothetical protein
VYLSCGNRCQWKRWTYELYVHLAVCGERKIAEDKPMGLLMLLAFRHFLALFHAFSIEKHP